MANKSNGFKKSLDYIASIFMSLLIIFLRVLRKRQFVEFTDFIIIYIFPKML